MTQTLESNILIFFQDGAEYDEYGNRRKERYGLGTRPRGYDRSDRYQETEQRPVYDYPAPSRTIDTKRKAVRYYILNFFVPIKLYF